LSKTPNSKHQARNPKQAPNSKLQNDKRKQEETTQEMQHTDPADPPSPVSADAPAGAGMAGIELALKQIIQAVSQGRDDRVGPLVDRLGAMFESLTPADRTAADGADGAATPQDLQRVRNLWKETSLALVSASQQASAELQRIAAGRSTLRAYRP
jgi:hypothetical protein